MSTGRDATEKVYRPETVLVAEDESIIALSIEDELTDAGYAVAGPFATTSATMGWLSTDTPDLAVLDTNLRDGSSRVVALELIRRRVSFVVYSGYRQTMNTTPEFDHGVWIEKPSPGGALTKALASLPRARIR
jgi:DNA-binding response OmpR family regulator